MTRKSKKNKTDTEQKPVPASDTPKATPKAPATKYPIPQLRAHCVELFSVSTSTFDAVAKSIDDTALSVEDMRAKIKTWGETAVKPKKEAK